MLPEDIGRLVTADSARLSPQGDLVAYVVTQVDLPANTYRSRIWLAPTDASRPPEPLTSGEHREANPCWSPDGRRLAYTVRLETEGGGETGALRVLPARGPGQAVTVATAPERITEVAWSPDGRSVAFTARVRDDRYDVGDPKRQPPRRITRLFVRLDNVGWTVDRRTHVHVVPADGSAPPRDITPGEWEHGQIAWLPDSSGVVASAARHDTWDLDLAEDVYVLPLDGDPVPLTGHNGRYAYPSPSPDGAKVAFVGFENPESYPRNDRLWVRDTATGNAAVVGPALDRTHAPYGSTRAPVWQGDDLLYAVEDRGNLHLYRCRSDNTGSPALVVGGERCLTSWDVAGDVIAFTATTADRPAELFVLVEGEERRISTHTDVLSAALRPRPAERFYAPSTGGADVDAWVVTPPGFDAARRYPALLNVHGGPFTQFGNRFFDEAQVQAAAGYVVLMANPRGSSGREEAWGRAICGPKDRFGPGTGWGSVDVDDVLAVVDEALRRFPFIDPERLGVLGGSYGGYMTSWLVSHDHRFKAACSERACNNLLTLEWTSDIASTFRTELGVDHLTDPAEYLARSPITYVRDIRTPLLILHSEEDLRCPIEQAEQMFVAMRLLGKEVEFHRFPAESHELSRTGSPVHRQQRFELILDWFGRYLRPDT
ncbi:MAG TPA: S9 family peptidase [Acidimicrobiales bacterium]